MCKRYQSNVLNPFLSGQNGYFDGMCERAFKIYDSAIDVHVNCCSQSFFFKWEKYNTPAVSDTTTVLSLYESDNLSLWILHTAVSVRY